MTISEKGQKRQIIFKLLIEAVILGLVCLLIGFPLNIARGMGFHLFSTPLKIFGTVLLIGSAVGLVLSYIVFGAPTENYWKKPLMIIPLGILPGGIIGFLIGEAVDISFELPFNMNINFMLLGLLIGFCVAILFVLRSTKSIKRERQKKLESMA